MNDKLERMCKEVVTTHLRYFTISLETEENHEKHVKITAGLRADFRTRNLFNTKQVDDHS
jgi:hypothetical protein